MLLDNTETQQFLLKSKKGEDVIQMMDGKGLSLNEKNFDNSKNDFLENDKINLPIQKISEVDELREKWNYENLEKRFIERINNHIKCAESTRN